MKRLSKLFRSRNTKLTSPGSVTIDRLMGQISEAAKQAFESDTIELLNEPLTNIVQALWVAPADKIRLTSTQRQIQDIMHPIILKIQDAVKTGEPAEAKDFAIDYLIKKLAILELAFRIESCKLNLIELGQSKLADAYCLADIEVSGHA